MKPAGAMVSDALGERDSRPSPVKSGQCVARRRSILGDRDSAYAQIGFPGEDFVPVATASELEVTRFTQAI